MYHFLHRLFLLLFIACTCGIHAQLDTDFLYGILLDKESGEPIVFATIRVKGKALGVISNKDGGFQIPLSFQEEGEELVISSMGYETKTILLAELKTNLINHIAIKPSTFQLLETVVKGKKKRRPSAKQIIKYALERIPYNYENRPFVLDGYYRDYQLKKNKYINLHEALIQVVDKGFAVNDYRTVQFGLYQHKKNFDFEVDSFAAKPYDYGVRDKFIPDANFGSTYASNELVLLFIHDAIRNHRVNAYSYVYTLVEDFIKEHRFSAPKNTTYGVQGVYKIEFRKIETPFKVKGTIYIDRDSYAIRKLDYAVYKHKPDDTSPSKYSLTEKELLYEILVEYKDFEKRMYLNYISFHNQFKLIRPPKFFIKDVLLNGPTQEIKVFLNKPAANWPNNFSVRYQGKSLKIKDVLKIDPSTFVLKFPQYNPRQQGLMNLLFSKYKDEKKPSLEIVIKELVDSEGNRLGERKSEIMDQFREFFTQKINPGGAAEMGDVTHINKKIPLGDERQPKIKAQYNEDFWMNTPLKSKE